MNKTTNKPVFNPREPSRRPNGELMKLNPSPSVGSAFGAAGPQAMGACSPGTAKSNNQRLRNNHIFREYFISSFGQITENIPFCLLRLARIRLFSSSVYQPSTINPVSSVAGTAKEDRLLCLLRLARFANLGHEAQCGCHYSQTFGVNKRLRSSCLRRDGQDKIIIGTAKIAHPCAAFGITGLRRQVASMPTVCGGMKTMLFLMTMVAALAGFATPLSAADTAAASKQIDALLAKSWQKQNLKGNAPVNDDVFLRRTYLTVVGRIPTADEAKAFLAAKGADKRAKLIDQLLASEGYVHQFFNYWADVLRAQSNGIGDSTTAQNYLNFIRKSLRENKPYDQFARELVSSEGTCFENGAVGYYMRDRGMPLDNLSNTTRIFLGTRLECAQCHDHPFDKWTQKQFYEMAAFTHNMNGTSYQSKSHTEAQKMIREDKESDTATKDLMRQALTEAFRPLRDTLVVQNKAAIKLPANYKYSNAKPNEVVQASVMFGKKVELTKESNSIDEFGKWMTSSDNPRFTTLVANRLWKKVFGLGIYEPVDEMMDDSVASNLELMKFLEKQMVALKYDMKAYLRMLLNTQAFARTATKEVSPGTPYYFQGPVFRRMSSEQVWDSIVTLVSPAPDQVNWSARERERRELANRKRLANMLDKTEAPLLIEAAKNVADAMREQNRGFDTLRKELDEARAKDDKEKAKEIQRKLNESQRILRETVSRCFYDAAKKSNNKEIQDELAAAAGGGSMDMAMMNLMGDSKVDIKEMQMDAKVVNIIKTDEELLGMKDAKSQTQFENYQRTLHQTWCRASELPSPAPRGHFLREFGQSDRDIIENANYEASVPQALTMMNGSIVTQLNSGWSVLSINMRKATTPEEKIDTLFLSLYSRKPSVSEKNMLFKMLDEKAASKTIWEDITLGMLSTQRFIFIE